MKTQITSLVVLVMLGLLSVAPVWAQRGMGRGQMQPYTRPFDPGTVTTLTGEVTEIVYVEKNANLNRVGVHLMVKTATETIPVHLGPVWYIENQEQFERGDQVSVTGSRVTFNDAPALVATKVIRGEMALQLRDQNGYPAWRGWRRNRMMNN